MNELFKKCVELLEWLAAQLHMTYEEVNIWIFVIIEPVVFLLMLWIMYRQYRLIRRLRAEVKAGR